MHSTLFDKPDARESLADLAGRARRGDAAATDEFRQRMTASLKPIVRLAMRRGKGLPPVVGWVRQAVDTIADGRSMPNEQYTTEITQLLCAELLRSSESGAASPRHDRHAVIGA